MEKLLYPLWRRDEQAADDFRDTLLSDVAPALLGLGVKGLRINVVDSAVADAAPLQQTSIGPALDAMLSIWVDSANDRAAIDAILEQHCREYCGFLVTESEPLPNDSAPLGERMPGWTQVVYLERPDALTEADWLKVWLGSHTDIAIETQSTFAYRQNVITRWLSEGGPRIHAIVEESFPDAAMASPHAFYDVESDEALEKRINEMVESCARFINFERINVVPTSEYLIKAP